MKSTREQRARYKENYVLKKFGSWEAYKESENEKRRARTGEAKRIKLKPEERYEHHKKVGKEWRKKNSEHLRKYNKEHAAERASVRAKRRANMRNLHPTADKKAMAFIYWQMQRLNKISKELGLKYRYHVDHIVPLHHGGLHHQDNLIVMRSDYNQRKSAKVIPEFIEAMKLMKQAK